MEGSIMTVKPVGLVYDQHECGWKLLREGCRVESESALVLGSFLLKGEEFVTGVEMRKRSAMTLGAIGQHHAERMLTEAKDIPQEWQPFILVFPDTLWEDTESNHLVPLLDFNGGQWRMYFLNLCDKVSRSYRLVRPRQ